MADQDDAAEIIRCAHCGTRNRVRAVASGTPRCAKCHQPLPWIVTADESDFAAEVIASMPVVVDFWAPWCGPCRLISPVLERLAQRYVGRMKLIKVNVDENQRLAVNYNAMSIPLLVLFQRGKEVDRRVGAVPEAQLEAWLEPYLQAPAAG